MATPFEDFVNLELPRRSPLLTKAITGYDGDPNSSSLPALNSAPLGTWFFEETAQKWWRKESSAPADWSNQTAGGGPTPIDRREQTFTPSLNQTVFPLAATPAVPNDTSMYVNTVKYIYGVHYTVSGATLTWSPVDFQLDSLDVVEIIYFV